MRGQRQNQHGTELTNELGEPARHATGVRTGTVLTALVSLLALAMSGLSLYQTVLKQANMHLFVPDTISYTRDPNGNYEVLVVPVTIANSGARDGVISSLRLKVRNLNTGRERLLHATYVADQGYFSTKEDFTKGISRPKTAFAPLTVAGRSGYSGTILFYPRKYSGERAVPKEGTFHFELSARMKVIERLDMIDQFLGSDVEPVVFAAALPKVSRYFDGAMSSGKFARLFVEEQPGEQK
jgi:hypothetical protein